MGWTTGVRLLAGAGMFLLQSLCPDQFRGSAGLLSNDH